MAEAPASERVIPKTIGKLEDWTWLTGTWELETTDNFDAFLTAEGLSWIVRKAAKVGYETQYLQVNLKTNSLKQNVVMTAKTTFGLESTMDGTPVKYKNFEKEDVISRTYLSEDGTQLIDAVDYVGNPDANKERVVYKGTGDREGKMLNKFTRLKDGVSMVRVFKKTSEEVPFPLKDSDPMFVSGLPPPSEEGAASEEGVPSTAEGVSSTAE